MTTKGEAENSRTYNSRSWIWPALREAKIGDRVQFTRDVWDADGHRRQVPDTEFLVVDRGPDFVRVLVS